MNRKIIVQIAPSQLKAQKENGYHLCLASKINDQYTSLWQSRPPFSSSDPHAYGFSNTFDLTVTAYRINYAFFASPGKAGGFQSTGKAVEIQLGQITTLDKYGLFSEPGAGGMPTQLTVENALTGNPSLLVYDQRSNLLYLDRQRGLDTGNATILISNEYQVWFAHFQNHDLTITSATSEARIIAFGDGETTKTISYTSEGQWQNGELEHFR